MKNQAIIEESDRLETAVSRALWKLGIPVTVSGYNYIKSAIMLKTETPQITLYNLTAKIAEEYETIPPRVERNIRYAIELATRKGSIELLERIFPTMDFTEKNISILKFITAIAEYLRLGMEQEDNTND